MPKYIANIATTNIDMQNQKFSGDALRMAIGNTAKEVPITLDFKGAPIGFANEFSIDEEAAYAALNCDLERLNIEKGDFYAVIGGIIEESHSTDIEIIDKFKITSIGITVAPADVTLKPIKRMTVSEDEEWMIKLS